MHFVRIAICVALISMVTALSARAQGLLRDPDIEYALGKLAEPILQISGLGPSSIDILIVNDGRLNAFVVDRSHIFINSGLIDRMTTPEMLQAVIAHEAAHMANGHLARRTVNFRNARSAAGIGSILAAAAAVVSGAPEAAGALAAGVQTSATRRFFAHTRAEENAADQTALRYMTSAGIDPIGMLDVLNLFRGQELLSTSRRDVYARTHPLSRDRFRVVEQAANANAGKFTHNENSRYWFMRAKSKLSAFQRAPKWTLTRAGESGYADVKAMRQAVAHHRQSQAGKAIEYMQRAIAERPNDPYYYELFGQILFESRRFDAAVDAYAKAAEGAPRNALILGSYGRALLATGKTREALELLEKSRARDGRDGRVLRDMALAYAKLGNNGMASVVTAERHAMFNRYDDARIHAKRAITLLPDGSAGWRRAQDVLIVGKQQAKNRR
ncbi:MAG: M48 family metalloprotease [Pseudomonadota bacterium]